MFYSFGIPTTDLEKKVMRHLQLDQRRVKLTILNMDILVRLTMGLIISNMRYVIIITY